MMKLTLVAMLLVGSAAGVDIQWTGIVNDQQWTTQNNWYPAQVPGPNDNVIIDDAGGNDATVVLVTNQPTTIRSLTMGSKVANKVHLRILAPLRVTGSVSVQANGVMEINSGAAALSSGNVQVGGELHLSAGTITGFYNIKGLMSFDTPAAKTLHGARVNVVSNYDVQASGSLQFASNSTVTANVGVAAKGKNFQCIVSDESTGNYVKANGFSWTGQ